MDGDAKMEEGRRENEEGEQRMTINPTRRTKEREKKSKKMRQKEKEAQGWKRRCRETERERGIYDDDEGGVVSSRRM